MIFRFLHEKENDPSVDTHILLVGSRHLQGDKKNEFENRGIVLKNNSPDSKADLSKISKNCVFGGQYWVAMRKYSPDMI